jgi:hypothetical protein
MTKDEAKGIFGGSDTDLAAALQLTREAITMWKPGELTLAKHDRVLGAALRLRKKIPKNLIKPNLEAK